MTLVKKTTESLAEKSEKSFYIKNVFVLFWRFREYKGFFGFFCNYLEFFPKSVALRRRSVWLKRQILQEYH